MYRSVLLLKEVLMLKKIDIRDYEIEVLTKEGIKKQSYGVVESIENVALATGPMTSQKLAMSQTLEIARIIEKLKEQRKDGKKFALLEDADFNKIKAGFEAFSGFGKNEVELCKRIANVEDVKVEEKKKKGK